MFDINLSIIENLNFFIVIGYSIKTRVMSKKWKKPSPSPRGVEGQNL